MATADRNQVQDLEARADRLGSASYGLPEVLPEDGGDFECTVSWRDEELGGATFDMRFTWDGMQSVWFDRGVSQDAEPARPIKLRPPETYSTVGDWWEDYRGHVPIQMAHGLSRYMDKHGCSFAEAYRALRGAGAIVEIDPPEDGR